MKQATDICSVLMCLQYCYVTTSNSVVNYRDIFSVKFCVQCEYSETCKPTYKYAKKCHLFRLRQYGNPIHRQQLSFLFTYCAGFHIFEQA